jgi:PDZ domain-containing protein/activator of Hsp90 ATPase-like protein
MEHRERADGFEATFVVSVPRAQAWKRLVDAEPVSDAIPPPAPGQIWIPAIEGAAEEIESVAEERLRATKMTEPCAGTEIIITMEDDASGTRITVVQTGFGEGFGARRPWLAAGWGAIVADFAAYFERGIALGRHLSMWWGIGCDVVETDEGLVVGNVHADGFAARAGLERDDLILRLAGSPVLDVRDLAAVMRGPLRSGVEAKAHVLRGDRVLKLSGTI